MLVTQKVMKDTGNAQEFVSEMPGNLFAAKISHQKGSQSHSDYNFRALGEVAMFRYKTIIGDKPYSRKLDSQKIEARIGCVVLNKMTALDMPLEFFLIFYIALSLQEEANFCTRALMGCYRSWICAIISYLVR